MNSLNTNSKPLFGTKDQWGRHAILWMIVMVLSILTAKSCNEPTEQPHLFISKQTAR